MLDLNTRAMETAIRQMHTNPLYTSGGHFEKYGLVWEVEEGTYGEIILTVYLLRVRDREVRLYAGPTACCELDREKFVREVSTVLKCPTTLSHTLAALAAI